MFQLHILTWLCIVGGCFFKTVIVAIGLDFPIGAGSESRVVALLDFGPAEQMGVGSLLDVGTLSALLPWPTTVS